jgi:hypothetical protein
LFFWVNDLNENLSELEKNCVPELIGRDCLNIEIGVLASQDKNVIWLWEVADQMLVLACT